MQPPGCAGGWEKGAHQRLLRDMDLGPIDPLNARRLEVEVDRLPLFGGAQLAVDTTLVSPLTRDGAAKPRAATMSGAFLELPRLRKEARYPELVGNQCRARLVVLAGEVGGRFSSETDQFFQASPTGRSVRCHSC